MFIGTVSAASSTPSFHTSLAGRCKQTTSNFFSVQCVGVTVKCRSGLAGFRTSHLSWRSDWLTSVTPTYLSSVTQTWVPSWCLSRRRLSLTPNQCSPHRQTEHRGGG